MEIQYHAFYITIIKPKTISKWTVIFHLQIQETSSLIKTILDVQPRMSSGGGAKSNDEIVFELADSILGKVMEKLDLENAKADMFEVWMSNKLKYCIPYNSAWTF